MKKDIKKAKKKVENEIAHEFTKQNDRYDVQGSYTGNPQFKNEKPIQDSDDM